MGRRRGDAGGGGDGSPKERGRTHREGIWFTDFCFLLRFGTYRPSSSRSASSSSSAGFVVISLSFDLELLSSLLPSLPSSFLHPPSVLLPTTLSNRNPRSPRVSLKLFANFFFPLSPFPSVSLRFPFPFAPLHRSSTSGIARPPPPLHRRPSTTTPRSS